MNHLELYSDQFNARKSEILLNACSSSQKLVYRKYQQKSIDKLIVPQDVYSYVVKGSKVLLIDGKEYPMKSGDLVFIPRFSAIFSYLVPGGGSFESINIAFSMPFSSDQTLKNTPGFIDDLSWKKYLKDILSLDPDSLPASFSDAQSNKKNQISYTENSTRTILNQISVAAFQDAKLPEISEKCNMSLSTFKRHFYRIFGLSPKEWLIKRKLESAYFDIRFLKKTVSEASVSAGFENMPHFSYSFKKHFGISPSSLIREAKNLS